MDANDQSSTFSSTHPNVDTSVDENLPSVQPSKRPRKESSEAWLYFDKVSDGSGSSKAKCKTCSQEYSTSGGTSNMLRHIYIPLCPGLLPQSQTQNLQSRYVFDESVFREKLSVALVKHNLPFTFVEYEGIWDVFEYLNSDVKSITRNTAKADVLKLHDKHKNSLRLILKSIPGRICLTADLWSSIATDGYLALPAHYVDENWSLQKRVLNFRHIPPPHNGTLLGGCIIDLLRDWGIEKKIFSITLDNASNNDGLVDVLKSHFALNGSSLCSGDFFHVRCGTHILNLVVQADLKIIDDSINKIRESVKYVRASEARKVKFARCIAQFSLSCSKKVCQDIPIRWNSTYLMLDFALYFRLAFQQFGSVDANFKWCLSDVEWERVRRISRFLKPFYEITTLFSGSQYPTTNLYFNGVWKIEWLIRQEMACLDEGIGSMAREMMQKFAKYWKCYSMVLSFAIILDPRFKLDYVTFLLGKLHSNVEWNQHVDKIRSEFKRLFDDYYRAPFNSPCGPSTCGDDDDEVSEFENVHCQSRRSESEFDLYLNGARLSSKQELDVLRYWRDKSSQYPTLAVMTRDILSIPITTVASESTFSIGGRIIDKFRSSLLLDTAEALLCTRDWLFGVDASQDSAEQESLMIDFAPFVAQLDTSARV